MIGENMILNTAQLHLDTFVRATTDAAKELAEQHPELSGQQLDYMFNQALWAILTRKMIEAQTAFAKGDDITGPLIALTASAAIIPELLR